MHNQCAEAFIFVMTGGIGAVTAVTFVTFWIIAAFLSCFCMKVTL